MVEKMHFPESGHTAVGVGVYSIKSLLGPATGSFLKLKPHDLIGALSGCGVRTHVPLIVTGREGEGPS